MKNFIVLLFSLIIISACNNSGKKDNRIRIIIDTDANNELDDQHALGYALLNRNTFDIEGITINNTRNGDGIEGHYQEAVRILQLFSAQKDIPVYKGAAGLYSEIKGNINQNTFDEKEAVDFIIERAKAADDRPLVLLPIGKLTNIALALQKAPEIKDKVRVIWLGANYPAAGEYNLENDTTSVNPVIQSGVPFEMALVRSNQPSGTAAVTITRDEINAKMPGRGVIATEPIIGRHGGKFETFGDYSVNLFANIKLRGNPPSRPLYDMAAVAIVKNPAWAEKVQINAPVLSGESWIEQLQTDKKIWLWQNFNKKEIIDDMFTSMDAGKLPQ